VTTFYLLTPKGMSEIVAVNPDHIVELVQTGDTETSIRLANGHVYEVEIGIRELINEIEDLNPAPPAA